LKRKRQFDKGIIILIIIVLVVVGTGVLLLYQLRTDKITDALNEQEQLVVLFMFTDEEELLFSEVFIYDPTTHRGSIFDVPGDVGSIIESLKRIDRIDVLFHPEKPEPYIEKIEEILDEEIPYYFQFNLADLASSVDLMEGLDMFIANPVEHLESDPPILLPAGSINLDGAKVGIYITYSIPEMETEIERINRKQRFLQAFLGRIGEKEGYLMGDEVFPAFHRSYRSNLDKNSCISFFSELAKLDAERIVFQRVLGVHRKVDNQTLLFPHYDGKLLQETVKQTTESLANTELANDDDLTVTLEILNGTTRNGLAGRTSQVFKSFGFEISGVGNADRDSYEKTIIIDRGGDIAKTQKVANIIRCTNIQADIDIAMAGSVADSDVIIILGKDFDGRYCK
jgi:anionic cell wall polymer biosynthesis LytR-Cps2A-Psr (LCP) family protein